MTRREIEYIAKLAASQANASGLTTPLAGQAPASKSPQVAPSSTGSTPETQSPGFMEGLMQSIQGLLSGIDLSKSGPMLGMLSPLFQSVGSVAGIPGLAAMTDLFRGGSNISTLGRGLFNRADTSDPDAAAKSQVSAQVNPQPSVLANSTPFQSAQKQTLQTPSIPPQTTKNQPVTAQQQTPQVKPPSVSYTSPDAGNYLPPPGTQTYYANQDTNYRLQPTPGSPEANQFLKDVGITGKSTAKPVAPAQPKPVQPKPPKTLSTQSSPMAKSNTQPRRSNAPLA